MGRIIFTLKQYLRYDIMLSFTKTRFHIFFIKKTNTHVSQRGDFFSKSKICGFSQMSELKLWLTHNSVHLIYVFYFYKSSPL